MNKDAEMRDIRERLDFIHGGYLAMHAAVVALVASHPNPATFQAAFAAGVESMRAHALALPHGDELCHTLDDVAMQIQSIPAPGQSALDGCDRSSHTTS